MGAEKFKNKQKNNVHFRGGINKRIMYTFEAFNQVLGSTHHSMDGAYIMPEMYSV